MTNRSGPYWFLALRRAKKSPVRQPRNAPQITTTPDKTPAIWQSLELLSKRITILTAIVAGLVVSVTLFIAVGSVARDINRHTITIAPISVPQSLANSGYTSDVVTQQLQIALNKILKPSHFMQFDIGDFKKVVPVPTLRGEIPSITVPGTGLSLDVITSYIRNFFPNYWKVSGEITIAHSQLYLRLQMAGQDRYVSEQGVDPDHAGDLFSPAAQKVLEVVAPSTLAEYLATREPSKSLRLARRVIKDHLETDKRRVAAMHVLIGRFLLLQNQTDKATTEFNAAVGLDPSAVGAHAGLRQALKSQGKIDAARSESQNAIDELREAANSNPRSASAHANLGFALLILEQGKTGEAHDEFDKAIELDPSDPDTHAALGYMLISFENNSEDGIAEIRNAIDLGSSSADCHLMLGAVLGDNGKAKEMMEEFATAVALEPHNINLHFTLANMLLVGGMTKEALDEFRKGIKIDPYYAVAHILLGNALYNANMTKEAVDEFRESLNLDPSFAYAHISLGNALLSQGQTDEAVDELRTAVKLDQSSTDAQIMLGKALLDNGKTEEAVDELNTVVKFDQSSSDAHIGLGAALTAQDKTGAALDEYRKAVELDQNSARAHRWLGGALVFQGEIGEAVAELGKAVDHDRENSYGVLWLYLARMRTGTHDAAGELESNEKKLKKPDWPYPVVELFLRRRTPKSTLAVPTKLDDRCDAKFYVGEWHLLHRDRPKALDSLKKAVETCPKSESGYGFARAELLRLGR